MDDYLTGSEDLSSPKRHKNLPHLDLKGHYQFITFRTYESVDDFIKKIQQNHQTNSQKQQIIDKYLDTSSNGAYLKNEILEYLYDFLKSKDKNYYNLIAFAIMSNHVHLLIKPLDDLSSIIHKIKGASAKTINQMLNKNGKFWANEYYDKAIRDEKHFDITYNYIKNNPLKLKESKKMYHKRFYGIYEA